jgi:ArsR family transcriptional regulator, arsenate/arsenite/antimonite-responsive transcriptional repressor
MENYTPDGQITADQIRLARVGKALSHPVRVYILDLLSKQTCCYSGDLAEILPIARSTLSQHLKELKQAGLIKGTTRPPRIMYCLNRENWDEAKKIFSEFLGNTLQD